MFGVKSTESQSPRSNTIKCSCRETDRHTHTHTERQRRRERERERKRKRKRRSEKGRDRRGGRDEFATPAFLFIALTSNAMPAGISDWLWSSETNKMKKVSS